MEKKLENMTKKELIERINDLETQCEDKDTAFASLHEQYTQFGIRAAKDIDDLKKKVYEAATAREEDIAFYKNSNAELKKKNESIHEEAKRWKKAAVNTQAELDELRASIGAADSDPMSVAMWRAKYNTLKYQFDKLKDEAKSWGNTTPAVQAALERKINVLEKEINKYKAEASEWQAKYEYQDGQTDCVIKDYNALNKKYESLRVDYAALSRQHDDFSAKYSNSVSRVTCLEERNKDLIRQCDELYDKNKELDAENDRLKNKLKDTEQRNVYLYDKNKRLKETVNKMYGVSSGIPDIEDTTDFDDRARKCAIIFSRTIDAVISAYNMDVNSYSDGSIAGVAKTVNTIRGGHIWLNALEESMRKFSEEAEKYIRKVGGKND